MHIVAAVDDRMSLLFNGRRQSRDGVLNERIASLCNGELWVSPFSATLFNDVDIVLHIDEHFLEQAADGAYCFIEDVSVRAVADAAKSVVLYKWNRAYPGDFFFDLPVDKAPWHLDGSEDFAGSSHDKITEEVYRR